MALPPNSFTSFSLVPPPPPPPPSSEPLKQPDAPRLDLVPPAAQLPILPPTDAPTSISEPTSAAPPTQSVTVVVSPTSESPRTNPWQRWASLGAIVGLAIGLGGAAYYHSKLPGEFESTARVQVNGPSASADADLQIGILRSRAVLERAAQKLDDFRPYEMPPPKSDAERVAYLGKGLSVSPEVGASSGSTLNVTFRGPHPTDTPKYLRAIVEAYKVELANRPAVAILPSKPSVEGPAPAPVASLTFKQIEAEQDQLKKQLVGKEYPAVIEKRLAASRTLADQMQVQQRGIDRDLALIRAAGTARRDRLGAMEELGIKADRAVPTLTAEAEAKSAEEALRALQLKKAELGQRLGAEHRDMIALDEQMAFMKVRIAKARPELSAGPDELDKHRVKLEADRVALAAKTGVAAGTIATDQKMLAEVAGLRTRLNERNAQRPPANGPQPKEAFATQEPPSPTNYSVQAVVPANEGGRVSPLLYKSLVPGGAIGLLSGGLLGLFGSLVLNRTKPVRKLPKRIKPEVYTVRASSQSVPITSGPKLGVPVFANVPALRADAPLEKRSAEGLSPLLVALTRASSAEAGVFRNARRELATALHSRGHQVISVTSPGTGDGKSLVAANLAISIAQSGKRVVLVDCDLKNAKIQELFRLTRLGDSLKSIMASEVDLRMALRSCEVPNLFVLPAGRGVTDPLDLLTRTKFREVIAELKSSYEYVILDAPSTLAEQEFAAISGTADGVVLVVRSGSDALARSDRARAQVIAAGARVLGAIVNAAPPAPHAPAEVKPKELALAL